MDGSDSLYEVSAFDYDTCLEASENNTSVNHAPCHDGLSQSWRIEAVGDEFFRLSTLDGEHCLSVPEIGVPEGTSVMQTTCTGEDTQLWFVERYDDLYDIVSAHNGHCLTAIVPDAGGSGDVLEAACEVDAEPQWVMVPVNLEMVYEDAEDGTATAWDVYDQDPVGAAITTVFDDVQESHVVELSGAGVQNGYSLRNANQTAWRNFSHTKISWDMQFSEEFIIYVDVETTVGRRYLRYTPSDEDLLGDGAYVHHGVGADTVDGQWRTMTRDLEVDLQEAQPEVEILEVNGFLIRGSGRIDNIRLQAGD